MGVDVERGFLLGDYEIRPFEGQIIGPTGSTHVPPKAMEVLVCLASNPREVVRRSHIVEQIWGEADVLDDALTHCVSQLRHALDDHHDHPKYIRTIHSRGYQLLAPVTPIGAAKQATAAEQAARAGSVQELRAESFWSQLKRRNVVQVTISYTLVAWVVIEVASTVLPQLPLPDWSVQLVILLTVAGFPIAIIMAWILEITPKGVTVDVSTGRLAGGTEPGEAGGEVGRRASRLSPLQLFRFWVALAISLIVGMGIAYYFVGAQIRFEAREWILLADFENQSSDKSLNQSLDLAFRIALEQSRYANVLPRSSARRALVRMKRDPNRPIDRELAVEIALREQAKVVVLGSLVEVGGVFSLAAVIVDPQNDQTLSIESIGVGELKGLLNATEELANNVRRALGESIAEIEDSSLALEKVTTENLDALKAYSAGVDWANRGHGEEAIALLQQAIDLDSEFAMAYASLGTVYRGFMEDSAKAFEQWEKAAALSDRLTHREQVYIQAARTWHGDPQEMIQAWSLMSNLYPDQAAGHHNLGLVYWEFENDFRKAREAFEKTVALPTSSAPSFYYLAYCHLAIGEYQDALDTFRKGWELDNNPMEFGYVDANVVLGRYGDAESFINENLPRVPKAFQLEAGLRKIGLFVDQGRLSEGLSTANQTLYSARQAQNHRVALNSQAAIVAILERRGDNEAFEQALTNQITENIALLQVDARTLDYSPLPQLALLGKVAARNQRFDLAQIAFDAIGKRENQTESFVRDSYVRLLQAEIMVGQDRITEAIAAMQNVVDKRDLFQAHESLARAFAQAGDITSAIEHYEWMVSRRGLAFSESLSRFYGKEFNIADWSAAWLHLAILRAESGDSAGSEAAYRKLIDHWSNGDPTLPALQQARTGLALESAILP